VLDAPIAAFTRDRNTPACNAAARRATQIATYFHCGQCLRGGDYPQALEIGVDAAGEKECRRGAEPTSSHTTRAALVSDSRSRLSIVLPLPRASNGAGTGNPLLHKPRAPTLRYSFTTKARRLRCPTRGGRGAWGGEASVLGVG